MGNLSLKYLKNNMWVEVCEGEVDIKMSDEYKKLVNDISDEEVSGGVYILNFYKVLDRLIENKLIDFEGGEMDWMYNELSNLNDENNFDKYYKEYRELIN